MALPHFAGRTCQIDPARQEHRRGITDPERPEYTLHALWGENNSRNLLNPALVPSGTLSRIIAAQAGPNYGAARAGTTPENMPAAVAPTWHGGRMRLTVTNIREAFPDPCCYLLDLRAYKRTIVNCDEDYDHRNRSTLTFTVT